MIDAIRAFFYHGPNGTSFGDLFVCAICATLFARFCMRFERNPE